MPKAEPMEIDEDEDDIVHKKRKPQKKDTDLDSDDEVVTEYDVVICDTIPNTEMYNVQFPTRKKNAFDPVNDPRIRYKKNVRMLEMRLGTNIHSGSFDKTKSDRFGSTSGPAIKQENGGPINLKTDEIYEGRSFVNDNPLQFAVGYMKNNTFFINPIQGTFEMHRSIAHMNSSRKSTNDESADLTGESDTEPGSSGGQQIRVKFKRPETDRQKKRREASALYREKMIANDSWIPMNVHLKEDPIITRKLESLTPRNAVQGAKDGSTDVNETPGLRDLVNRAIICGKMEQLDLNRPDQQLSHQRIRELPSHLQVKAQIIKARVSTTDDVARLVDSSISRYDLIRYLQQCAHLVQGVWVLQSGFLFQGLPPANCNTAGKTDEDRMELWRAARDLSLCLIDAGHKVTRATLSRCFRLNSKDAEEIFNTFGVKGNQTWTLRIKSDNDFLESPENLPVIVEERNYWMERWEEIQKRIDKSVSPKRNRRSSGKSSSISPKKEQQ